MKNITYLLGAGASVEALPVVNGIPKELDEFAKKFDPGELKDLSPAYTFSYDTSPVKSFLLIKKNNESSSILEKYHELVIRFYKDIIWLKDEAKNHSSIDTYAKKLYIQKDFKNLKRLKIILSCFFLYLQTQKFDKRYDSFFASILDDISKLPKNIKVLSWNYDSQIEIAFQKFSNQNLENTKESLSIISKETAIKENKDLLLNFAVFKINGTTGLSTNYDEKISNYEIIEDFNVNSQTLVNDFIELYDNSSFKSSVSNMSFAWENFDAEKGFFPNLSNSVSETEILIVIGYSFPFFNRKIDRLILDSMPELKKVYVQDPKYGDDIIEKMKGLIPRHFTQIDDLKVDLIKFEKKEFVDQFFIPIEF